MTDPVEHIPSGAGKRTRIALWLVWVGACWGGGAIVLDWAFRTYASEIGPHLLPIVLGWVIATILTSRFLWRSMVQETPREETAHGTEQEIGHSEEIPAFVPPSCSPIGYIALSSGQDVAGDVQREMQKSGQEGALDEFQVAHRLECMRDRVRYRQTKPPEDPELN